ncbi:Uncharacterised protein [Bacteroides xylanisolvens]|nr:Uncharacterised protein [Bacteroides xylanisolvens]
MPWLSAAVALLQIAFIELFQDDFIAIFIQDTDVETDGLEFLHEDLEGFRYARTRDVFALDDLFIGFDTADDIIGLHSQDFLQRVSRAVGFESPDFHFTETLAAELCLAAQRLLGNEGVWAGGAGMDLIIDEMMEL